MPKLYMETAPFAILLRKLREIYRQCLLVTGCQLLTIILLLPPCLITCCVGMPHFIIFMIVFHWSTAKQMIRCHGNYILSSSVRSDDQKYVCSRRLDHPRRVKKQPTCRKRTEMTHYSFSGSLPFPLSSNTF